VTQRRSSEHSRHRLNGGKVAQGTSTSREAYKKHREGCAFSPRYSLGACRAARSEREGLSSRRSARLQLEPLRGGCQLRGASTARFYYGGAAPAHVSRPRLRTAYYELRFRNGYVTGIAATRRLDRFLSYGVNLERFARYNWYRVPPEVSREFRRLSLGLRPLRLTRAALSKSR